VAGNFVLGCSFGSCEGFHLFSERMSTRACLTAKVGKSPFAFSPAQRSVHAARKKQFLINKNNSRGHRVACLFRQEELRVT
jgi:hypothetical protein